MFYERRIAMYFNEMMFNREFVNPTYYQQMRAQMAYQESQDKEVVNVAKACRELCQAAKKLDEQHQQKAFFACLNVLGAEYGWQK